MLKQRAKLYANIRSFFAERDVLEVDTPILSSAANCDINVDSFCADSNYYLQTSPEFAMKRLLAAGMGAIYQISHSFRQAESGHLHNPEFTLLEWYQPSWSMAELIQEVSDLLSCCINPTLKQGPLVVREISYAELFSKTTGLDAHNTSIEALRAYTQTQNNPEAEKICGDRLADWLDYIFSMYIQPSLAKDELVIVSYYPSCQAMLAKLTSDIPAKAIRFEVYYQAVELANGYEELTDASIQQQRFEAELAERKANGKVMVPMDQNLIDALSSGMPACSGVALGLDRLLMLMMNVTSINDVLSFPIARA